jgi:catechol 2,3-dioxygenase-like lactoylglutathione lyase family enzyme
MNFSLVHHISINVADNESARAFYVDTLGFDELERPSMGFNGAWLQIGDQQLHLLEVENHEPPVGQHFAFKVDDIHQYRDYLIGKGTEVSQPTELGGVCLQCFFKDPSGNLLELNQPC